MNERIKTNFAISNSNIVQLEVKGPGVPRLIGRPPQDQDYHDYQDFFKPRLAG